MPLDLHPDLEALAPLLGTWAGQARASTRRSSPSSISKKSYSPMWASRFWPTRRRPKRWPTANRCTPRPDIFACRNRVTSSWFWPTRAASPKSKWARYSVTGDLIEIELATIVDRIDPDRQRGVRAGPFLPHRRRRAFLLGTDGCRRATPAASPRRGAAPEALSDHRVPSEPCLVSSDVSHRH